jgi:1-pyrroline-5-carboxylate dehydrogenase
MNLVGGEWVATEAYKPLIDPMTGKDMISIPDTQMHETTPFIESLRAVPRHGLHNPIKNPERYIMLGDVCRKTSEVLHDPEVMDYFIGLVMRSIPKSYTQTYAEIKVTRAFFDNFAGDNVRLLAESF